MKKRTLLDLDDFEQISENHLRNVARVEGPTAPVHSVLKIADEWRAANCTPVFIVTRDTDDHFMMACVAKETFGKYLN